MRERGTVLLQQLYRERQVGERERQDGERETGWREREREREREGEGERERGRGREGEGNLDRVEDRMSLRTNRRLEQIARVSLRPNRAIQERLREARLNESFWRRVLSRNS